MGFLKKIDISSQKDDDTVYFANVKRNSGNNVLCGATLGKSLLECTLVSSDVRLCLPNESHFPVEWPWLLLDAAQHFLVHFEPLEYLFLTGTLLY